MAANSKPNCFLERHSISSVTTIAQFLLFCSVRNNNNLFCQMQFGNSKCPKELQMQLMKEKQVYMNFNIL